MFRPLRAISTYGRLKRYREVVFIFLKYGFDDIVDRIGPDSSFLRRIRRRGKRIDLPTAARLRCALSDLGPTFVKLGQVLSTRPDLLPEDYIAELEKLQDRVPPFPYEGVVKSFLRELNADPGRLFLHFDEQPIASASIAQVHKASLQDGRVVAVKVQRPGIRRLIETDLAILTELSLLLEKHAPELKWLRPSEIVNQFANTIRRELDFIAEAQAIERFRANFAGEPLRLIPRVHWDFSTGRILTTDFVDGVKITDLKQLEARGLDRKVIARNGARFLLKEVFEHRLFHADPHPGNFFVLEGNVIATVDFGIVGRLDEETVDHLGRLLSAAVHNSAAGMVQVFRQMDILEEGVDRIALRGDLAELLDRYSGLPLERIDAELVVQDLLRIVRRHRIVLPVSLALLGRMLAVSAGVGRLLDPQFDILAESKPFVQSFLMRRMDPRKRMKAMAETWRDYEAAIRAFPSDLEEILAKIKKGKMLVALHHEGLNRFILEMDRSSNRLAFGLIIAALIIGSSLIMRLDRGPMLMGFPALGLAGYLAAGILGLWLVIAILRSGRI